MEKTYLGFDLSTQKLKAVQLSDNLEPLYQAEVKFDHDFPEYQTNGGVRASEKPNEFYCNPVMWIRALETVLDRLLLQGANFMSVISISGSTQQHGSVYWNKNGIESLHKLDPDNFLYKQLNEDAFAVKRSPIWMDSSTGQQCREMEEFVGGKDEMVKITGSKCYERFTGAQIRKIFQEQRESYNNTERISLVSSFLASLFLNKIAPIDHSDGSGMNLLDINTRSWSKKCLDACADSLQDKLGDAVPTDTIIGKIGQFFVQRYNFNPDCKIVAFTGDNPSALAGLNINDDCLAFSLGTSDTIMLSLDNRPAFNDDGHILIHPTKKNGFMGLLCFKNAALIRDTFKKAEANNSWEIFSELLQSSPRGNNGYMAAHYLTQEILPNVKGTLRWSVLDNFENSGKRAQLIQFPTQQIEIRALIEGQMLNRKIYAMEIGFKFGNKSKILATGGTSNNHTILQVMSDVFNSPVYIQKTPEAACLGAAYRAKYAMYKEYAMENGDTCEDYHNYIKKYCDKKHNYIQRVAEPHTDSQEIYDAMLLRYKEMMKVMMQQQE